MSSPDALDNGPSDLLSNATLTALQLNQQPFGPVSPEESTFNDDITGEQLADVKQALITGDDLLLVLGETGSGKSALLRQLSENSGLRIQCFAVKGSPRFSTLNLFAGMLEAFKRPPPEKLKDILDELIPCLQTMVTRNTLSAIVLDDAHLINENELTQLLSSMLYVNSQDETLMRVTLAAPGAFEDRIPDLLPEGADMPYSSLTIDGMSAQRAAHYLEFRLQQAGYNGEWPFSDTDIDQLLDTTDGMPGALNTAAAELLNQEYGPLEESMPVELLTEKGDSFLHTRMGKLVLGLLATVFIVGGLSMFMPDSSEQDTTRYTVAEQSRVETDNDAPKLELVTEEPASPENEAESDSSDATDSESDASLADSGAAEGLESAADDITATAQSELTDTLDTAVDEDFTSENAAAQDPIDDTASAVATDGNEADNAGSDNAAATITIVEATNEQINTENSTSESDSNPIEASAEEATAGAAAAGAEQDSTETGSNDPEATAQDAAQDAAQDTAKDANQDSAQDPTLDPALANILESPTWILVQDAGLFTVQMSASRDRPSVENFLKRNAEVLPPPNSIYTFVRDDTTWFALVHGLFPSISEARAAVERMPSAALTNQPWIRNVGRVQDALKAQ